MSAAKHTSTLRFFENRLCRSRKLASRSQYGAFTHVFSNHAPHSEKPATICFSRVINTLLPYPQEDLGAVRVRFRCHGCGSSIRPCRAGFPCSLVHYPRDWLGRSLSRVGNNAIKYCIYSMFIRNISTFLQLCQVFYCIYAIFVYNYIDKKGILW